MILVQELLAQLLKFGKTGGATGTDPELLTAKVMLYSNNISPTVNSVIGDLTENTFAGYARSAAVVWGGPVLSNVTQLQSIPGDAKTFTVTTNIVPEFVQGYALVVTISAVDHLLAIQPIANPIQPLAGTEIIVQPRIGLNQTAVNPPGDVTFQ